MTNETLSGAAKTPEASSTKPQAPDLKIAIDTRSRVEETQERPKIIGEVMNSHEIAPETVVEVTNFYRYIFGNTMHFIAAPDLGESLTAREFFGTGRDFVPVKQMDALMSFPDNPWPGEEALLVYHPPTLRKNLERKLIESEDSILSLLRNEKDEIVGLAFCYVSELLRELELEWISRYNFADPTRQKPEWQRDPEKFLKGVERVYGKPFDGSEVIMAWNCMSVLPEASGSLPLLMRNMLGKIGPDQRDMLMMGDVKKDSKAHQIFRTIEAKDGTGFFEDEGDILIGGIAGTIADTFSMDPEEFKKKRQVFNKNSGESK